MAITQFDPVNAASASGDDGGEGLDFVGFLRRRKSFIFLLACLGVGAGYLLFHRQSPSFSSQAWVQVIHRTSDPRLKTMLSEKDLSDADYVIKSPKVLNAAFMKHGLFEKTEALRNMKRVKESEDEEDGASEEAISLMTEMITTKNLSSAVVQITCTGNNPADTRLIANAVAEEYLALQNENYKDASDELESLLKQALDDLHTDLSAAEKEYSDFRKTSPLMTDGGNPHRVREEAIRGQLSSIELQRAQLKSELDSLRAALERGGNREAILLLVNKQTVNTASGQASSEAIQSTVSTAKTMAEALFPLMLKEATLRTKLGEDHPELRAIRLQIDLTQQHLKELAGIDASVKENQAGEPLPPEPDFLQVYLDSLDQELQILEKQKFDLEEMATKEESAARSLMQEEILDRNKQNAIGRLSNLFDGITLQMREIELNADMGGVTAQVLAPARHGELVFPILSQFLGLGAFLGGFVGLVIGYLVEVADRSFRKPEDIIREFGVPIVGHIPFMSDSRLKSVSSNVTIDRTAVSVHLPRSRPAEAYRSVRTAINFSPIGGSNKLVMVTSPAAGDGKSTLAINLAVSMAQSGKRTLLVESDFRRPKVHKLTGVRNKVGIVDVLRGMAELTDAIQTTEVPDFFVLPCGSRPKDPSELLTRREYEQLLAVLKEKFDLVIIDTPPVLAVTDPCSVAPRVDGVIVCMRLSRHTRELGRRTVEQLRDVGANIAGIVVNGVEERDSYGYGTYRYSDYRYYYKSYNYKNGYYGDERSKEDYFNEEAGTDLTLTDTLLKEK